MELDVWRSARWVEASSVGGCRGDCQSCWVTDVSSPNAEQSPACWNRGGSIEGIGRGEQDQSLRRKISKRKKRRQNLEQVEEQKRKKEGKERRAV